MVFVGGFVALRCDFFDRNDGRDRSVLMSLMRTHIREGSAVVLVFVPDVFCGFESGSCAGLFTKLSIKASRGEIIAAIHCLQRRLSLDRRSCSRGRRDFIL